VGLFFIDKDFFDYINSAAIIENLLLLEDVENKE